MKIVIDGKEIYELNETKMKVIQNDINVDQLMEDIERRVKFIVYHKYEQCLNRLLEEWMPKLSERITSIPTDKDKLSELIFSQPDYACKKMRCENEKLSKENLLAQGNV